MSQYSLDLRKKVLQYLDQHQNISQAGKTFNISRRTIHNWIKLQKQDQLAGKGRTYKPRKLDYKAIADYVDRHDDAYIREIASALGYSKNGVAKALKKLNLSLKKKPAIQGKK
jgi:transposase